MTAQMPDELIHDGRSFAITAVDGGALFEPAAFGLEPSPISTARYRGHVVTYSTLGDRLTVTELALGSAAPPPAVAGVVPDHAADDDIWWFHHLAVPVHFTGRLLIGDGDAGGTPHLNMGFWPAWMYADVYELRFRAGALVDRADRSAELAAVRDRLGGVLARPADGESTADWITRTFSLTFAYSWPGSPDGPER